MNNVHQLPILRTVGKADLSRFCDEFDARSICQRPFALDGMVYATNGHILVRASAADHPEVLPLERKPSADVTLPIQLHYQDAAPFGPLPSPPSEQFCPHCFELIPAAAYVGAALFDCRYLRLIAGLPNVEVHTRGQSDPMTFRFAGGIGVLMPISPEADEKKPH